MRVILDEDIPRSLTSLFREGGHDAIHIEDLGWKGIKNGELLDRISGTYDVLVTGDTNMALSRTWPVSMWRSSSCSLD